MGQTFDKTVIGLVNAVHFLVLGVAVFVVCQYPATVTHPLSEPGPDSQGQVDCGKGAVSVCVCRCCGRERRRAVP